jgi:hypothetical protein
VFLTMTMSLKARAMLTLAYGCGLRAGEVVRLRAGDIDGEQMIIRIVQSKGRKDRLSLRRSRSKLGCRSASAGSPLRPRRYGPPLLLGSADRLLGHQDPAAFLHHDVRILTSATAPSRAGAALPKSSLRHDRLARLGRQHRARPQKPSHHIAQPFRWLCPNPSAILLVPDHCRRKFLETLSEIEWAHANF